MDKKTTLKDIAKDAGVSAMTVSKALNNKSGISEKTRMRILESAKRLNYRPNMVAKSLRIDETRTLGVVLSDSSEMVTSKILRGIDDAASRQGYSIIIANTDHDPSVEKRSVELLINKRIDGLLLVAPICYSPADIEWLQSFSTPTVLLMRQNNQKPLDTVINDNLLGGYQIVQYLIEQGSRDFAFLPLSRASQSGLDRLKGYKKALSGCSIPFDPHKVLFTSPFIEAGYTNTRKLLESSCTFDCLVCGCDLIAIGAIEALREAGISVPGDVRVSGYDDIALAGYLRVPLTTMHQPLYDMGFKGVNLLFDRMSDPQMAVQKVVLKSELIVRDSA